MAAFNENQVTQQISNAIVLANQIVKTQNMMFQWLENEEVTTQNWNNLGTDFPSLVGGTQQNTDPILIQGFEQPFSPQQMNQFDNAVQQLRDALDGVDVTITTNLGRNIRRLTAGVL